MSGHVRVWCLRHGESENVTSGIAGAVSSAPLTELGQHQAELAAGTLKRPAMAFQLVESGQASRGFVKAASLAWATRAGGRQFPSAVRGASAGCHGLGDPVVCLCPDVYRDLGKGVVPEREATAAQLHHALGAGDQEEVQVCAAITPAVDVDAGDAAESEDGPFHSLQYNTQLRGPLGWQIAEIVVAVRLEFNQRGKTGGLGKGAKPPMVISPEELGVGAGALLAVVRPGLALARGLRQHRGFKDLDLEIALVGEDLPERDRALGRWDAHADRQLLHVITRFDVHAPNPRTHGRPLVKISKLVSAAGSSHIGATSPARGEAIHRS